jgi:hypothetical protein
MGDPRELKKKAAAQQRKGDTRFGRTGFSCTGATQHPKKRGSCFGNKGQ